MNIKFLHISRGNYLYYFLLLFFFYPAVAIFAGMMSVYLIDRGFTATEVSAAAAAGMFFCVLMQSAAGILCERFDKRKVLGAFMMLACAGAFVFMKAESLPLIVVSFGLTNSVFYSLVTLVERVAALSPHGYGKIRYWGTFGYALGMNFAGVLYDNISHQAPYYLLMGCLVIAFAGMMGTKDYNEGAASASDTGTSVKGTKKDPDDGSKDSNDSERGSLKDILLNKTFLTYLLITGLFFICINIRLTYQTDFIRSSGLSVAGATRVLFVATLAELPLVTFGGKFIDGINNKTLLAAVMCMMTGLFLCYGLSSGPVPVAIGTIFLANNTSTFFTMVNMKMIATLAGEKRQMSVLGLVGTWRFLITIPFQLLSGPLLTRFSYSNMFLMMSGLAAAAAVISVMTKFPSGRDVNIYGH